MSTAKDKIYIRKPKTKPNKNLATAIIINGENIAFEVSNDQRAVTTFSHLCTGGLRKYSKARKINRSIRIIKEEMKWLFTEIVIVYMGNPKESMKSLLD